MRENLSYINTSIFDLFKVGPGPSSSHTIGLMKATGHPVVTAPTSGSSGVLPAVIYLLRYHLKISERELHDGFCAAALVGFIAKHNASISGAEVGCQGEIGVASAMAAAMAAYIRTHSIKRTANATEIALEHHLGMTCDPVGGYVQIPCIERNAVGAVTAYNACLLTSICDPHKQKIVYDEAGTGNGHYAAPRQFSTLPVSCIEVISHGGIL